MRVCRVDFFVKKIGVYRSQLDTLEYVFIYLRSWSQKIAVVSRSGSLTIRDGKGIKKRLGGLSERVLRDSVK